MENEKIVSGEAFQIQNPPPARNGSRVGLPLMGEFIRFLDANEGTWAMFHVYSVKQSGYQRASDARKKYWLRIDHQ